MDVRLLKPIRFGDFLLERAAITEAQLLDALADHWVSGRRLGEAISHRGYLPSSEIERYASEYQNLQTVYV
jgi:hypothetical protein